MPHAPQFSGSPVTSVHPPRQQTPAMALPPLGMAQMSSANPEQLVGAQFPWNTSSERHIEAAGQSESDWQAAVQKAPPASTRQLLPLTHCIEHSMQLSGVDGAQPSLATQAPSQQTPTPPPSSSHCEARSSARSQATKGVHTPGKRHS